MSDRVAPAPGTRILVVDDEPDVVEILRFAFEGEGYVVDTATDGAQALARLAESHYDAIVSDVRMPTLDGAGLYDEVVRRYPALVPRMLFITGDALGVASDEFLERTGAAHISKPFNLLTVLQTVQAILALTGGGAVRPQPERPDLRPS